MERKDWCLETSNQQTSILWSYSHIFLVETYFYYKIIIWTHWEVSSQNLFFFDPGLIYGEELN